MPSATDVQNYLNDTAWGRQANVHFTVSSPITVDVDYDLLPINADGTTGDGKLNNFKPAGSPITEPFAILTAEHNQTKTAGSATHLEAFYVKQAGPAIGCTQDCDVPDGISFTGAFASFIGDMQSGANTRVNVTAHELGHAMGANDVPANAKPSEHKNLMYGHSDGTNPCRIKDADWKIVNPTPGDK